MLGFKVAIINQLKTGSDKIIEHWQAVVNNKYSGYYAAGRSIY